MGRRITNGITTSNVSVPATLNIVNTTISTSETNANLVLAPDGTGIVSLGSKNLTTTGTVTVGTITNNGGSDSATFNTISANGLATFNEISEITQTLTNATGTVAHDFSGGGIFYHTTPAANWTAQCKLQELVKQYAGQTTLSQHPELTKLTLLLLHC